MNSTRFRWACCVLICGSIAAHDAQAQYIEENNLTPLKASLKSVLNSHTRIAAAREEVSAARFRAIGLGKPIYNPKIGADAESAEVNTYAISLNQSVSTGGKRAIFDSAEFWLIQICLFYLLLLQCPYRIHFSFIVNFPFRT